MTSNSRQKAYHNFVCSRVQSFFRSFSYQISDDPGGLVRHRSESGGSQEFTRGNKPGVVGDESPQRGPGAEYGNSREHQRSRDKN